MFVPEVQVRQACNQDWGANLQIVAASAVAPGGAVGTLVPDQSQWRGHSGDKRVAIAAHSQQDNSAEKLVEKAVAERVAELERVLQLDKLVASMWVQVRALVCHSLPLMIAQLQRS